MSGPRRNRVDPWGDLHAVAARGMFTGNRGCLLDDARRVVRHHGSALWITCRLEFRGWRHPLDAPRRWTPIFFLDDAVALAAGHRPCALCRRDDYRSFRDAVTAAAGASSAMLATELTRRLATERLFPGRGLVRAGDRRTWPADVFDLPAGTVVIDDRGTARLLLDDRMPAFGFDGWHAPVARPRSGEVRVLTPPTSVAALADGFVPTLHPSSNA